MHTISVFFGVVMLCASERTCWIFGFVFLTVSHFIHILSKRNELHGRHSVSLITVKLISIDQYALYVLSNAQYKECNMPELRSSIVDCSSESVLLFVTTKISVWFFVIVGFFSCSQEFRSCFFVGHIYLFYIRFVHKLVAWHYIDSKQHIHTYSWSALRATHPWFMQ